MVVGAGALGNEIIKDLALLGVGTVLIVDCDQIEISNLSRAPLFRTSDVGQPKAIAAARAATDLSPDSRFLALKADVTTEVGLGVFRRVDVVICGLDNREARLAVNRACWKVGKPWVDGATEDLRGVVRSFVPPDGPCYECTLSEFENKLIAVRQSCGFLAREAYRQNRTPTTPTTASVIAGIEVQEAVKILHALSGNKDCSQIPGPALVGRGFFFDGATYDCFIIEYTRREDCLSHELCENVVETDLNRESATLTDVYHVAREHLGDNAKVEFPCEMVTALWCRKCGSREEFYRLVRSLSVSEICCPRCGEERLPEVEVEFTTNSSYGGITLEQLGFGIMEILPARLGDSVVNIEISGDARNAFGNGLKNEC